MGGRGLTNGGNRVVERISDNQISFTIQHPTQPRLNVAPILGPITEQNRDSGVQKINNVSLDYRLKKGDGQLYVTYSPFSKMDRFTISHLRGIANKVAYCQGCKACEVQCPTGAFTIQSNGQILIRQNLCCHCSNCLTFCEKSCLAAKSLSTTGGGSNMNMKGMNAYQHFGLRQPWIEHFMADGVNCFGQGVLGNRQYDALKVWLRDAGIIKSNKDKTISVTSLGEKLIQRGSYNPFVWAIIWANLAYNSTICRWYCLNTEIGATYEKGDLVVMIGEEYSKSTRDNAVTSLLETLRQSPIGSALQQGIPMELSKTTYSYYRAGWEYPHAVALLYALYLYAEHTGRKSFTFSELVNAHSNPDAKGISPADIYGIDVKKFREDVQGLAISFPKHIRVSFVANLDNIILEDYSSDDIIDLAEE